MRNASDAARWYDPPHYLGEILLTNDPLLARQRSVWIIGSVCGGGEPVNKLAENGTFVSTETTYCRLTKMRATDLVLDALERVQPSLSPRDNPSLPFEMPARVQDQCARWR